MLFEGREIKDYAEPVPVDQLEPGVIYFAVDFYEDEMLTPVMEPKVYIGRDLDPEEEGCYFQDLDSYNDGIRFASSTPEDDVLFEIGIENRVYDYEEALEILMACSLRRRSLD